MTHGTVNAYNYRGCRCERCREAKRQINALHNPIHNAMRRKPTSDRRSWGVIDVKQILQCLADGLSEIETAEHIGKPYEAIHYRLQVSRRRKQAKSTNHLIAIAFREGFIQ